MDEFYDMVVSILVLCYNMILIIGTAYMVQMYDWSMWTFALTLIFFISKTKPTEKEE
jgi:biotin transporter BioY